MHSGRWPGARLGLLAIGLLGAVVLTCLLATTGSRAAAATQATRLPGPASLALGFVDDPLYENTPPASELHAMTQAARIGSTWVRLSVIWNEIAPATRPAHFSAADPADPHYTWTSMDAAVRAAAAAHQHILLSVYSPPAWALGKGPPNSVAWKPSPADLGAFALALARRYDGRFSDPAESASPLPQVSAFQAWNEPNLPGELSPQWVKTSTGHYAPFAPGWYRRMLNAFYAGVTRVQPRAFVLAAGLEPYGDPPGTGRMHPVTFAEALLCLNAQLRPLACADPAHLDGIDSHPYSVTPVSQALNVDDTSLSDVYRLVHVLAVAGQDHRVLPSGPKQTWVTEIEWPSHPPGPGGLSARVQARYLALAFYSLWAQKVSHILWFGMSDRGDTDDQQVLGSGVFYASGAAKPAAHAFAFPFVALPVTRSSLTVWGRAPQTGRVTIEVDTPAGWQRVTSLLTTPGGIFEARVPRPRAGVVLRAVEQQAVSLNWTAVRGVTGN
jgi:hypothetical protein